MVTSFPEFTALLRHADRSTRMRDRVGLGAVLRQWFCGLHGHDSLLQFERNRIFLQCASCGFETPGWQIAQRRLPRTHLHAHVNEPRTRAGSPLEDLKIA